MSSPMRPRELCCGLSRRSKPMSRRVAAWMLGLIVVSTAWLFSAPLPQTGTVPAEISDQEFWRLVTELSEPSGDYPYQNFVSNEITLQRIIPPTKRAIRSDGVYIGVGPEQNFTYVSALKSRMAFVVDIRRQNVLLHLMYKALFEMSPSRADFMTNLFSRRKADFVDERTTVSQIFDQFERSPAEAALQARTSAAIRTALTRHGFALSDEDFSKIAFIHEVFFRGGPTIDYAFSSSAPATSIAWPTYRVLMTATDAVGHNWSYLATEESYLYVREMHRRNMIIPVTGDFAGPKTLRAIAQYLKEKKLNADAFYISNVETYLNPQQLLTFYRNVEALPLDSSSILMRFVNGNSNSVFPWWKPSAPHQSVVSRINDLVKQVNAGPVAFPSILRNIPDPAVIEVPCTDGGNC